MQVLVGLSLTKENGMKKLERILFWILFPLTLIGDFVLWNIIHGRRKGFVSLSESARELRNYGRTL